MVGEFLREVKVAKMERKKIFRSLMFCPEGGERETSLLYIIGQSQEVFRSTPWALSVFSEIWETSYSLGKTSEDFSFSGRLGRLSYKQFTEE